MKSEQEIKDRLKWLLKAVDDEENKAEISQIKLWEQIELIKWLVGLDTFREWCQEK